MEPQPPSPPVVTASPAAVRHRRSPRIVTNALLDLTAPREVLFDHRIVNINLDGLAIDAPVLEPVGAEVELTIHFPELEARVETAGEVVWAREAPCRQMGIRFIAMAPADRALLGRYLYLRKYGR